MKRVVLWTAMAAVLAGTANAHFQVLIPSDDIVTASDSRSIELNIEFTHPMEQGPLMHMDKPAQFGVQVGDEKTDLIGTLKARAMGGKTAYTCNYTLPGPGDYIFYLEPAPYWEPAEQKMIVHYTKTIVDAFGADEGWDEPVGFPVEIMPLTRPYGLWSGNLFRGVVMKDGRPVPNAEIEVEYWNTDGVDIPSDPYVTQVIKADEQGVFSYAMPRAGWWSFAALIDGDKPMKNPDGKSVDVELGALIWVHTVDMK